MLEDIVILFIDTIYLLSEGLRIICKRYYGKSAPSFLRRNSGQLIGAYRTVLKMANPTTTLADILALLDRYEQPFRAGEAVVFVGYWVTC